MYGGDVVPGTYLKTRTGIVRGEQLFSRPDLERPWRSTETQHNIAALTMKEKEVEELMRLCSNLRTELGNAKSDARFLEYSLTESTKAEVAAKNEVIAQLEERVEKLEKEKEEMKISTDAQIRLLKSQADNEVMMHKSEARLATERNAELVKTYQQQITEVKQAGVREVEFVESRFKARVDELTTELNMSRELKRTAEEHYKELEAQSSNMVHRVESDFKERLRSAEKRIEEQRKVYEETLDRERKTKATAVADARKSTEKLATALIEKDDLFQKQKLWNSFILSGLDIFYHNFIQVVPELAKEPIDAQLAQIPHLYAPRCILEEPEAKVTLERVGYRVIQLKQLHSFELPNEEKKHPSGVPPTLEQLAHVTRRQERLRKALDEADELRKDLESTSSSLLSRMYFFSDNLGQSVQLASREVLPPLRNVVLVCLCIPTGRALWSRDSSLMRVAVHLLYSSLRLKLGEYGGYECYSDDVSMLVAFSDGAAACRFCTETQEWLMRLPWPSALLDLPDCREERGEGSQLVYRGLRLAMAMHAGETYVELSGIPSYDTYRNHYYGKAVSQLVHLCALTQGGQIVVSRAAWALCAERRHEFGSISAATLGAFPIVSFNSQTATQEKQSIELLQILPKSLEGRSFKATSKMQLPVVSALGGVKQSVLASEISAMEAKRDRLHEALSLLREESHAIQGEVGTLLTRSRSSQAHFHLLPPPEMLQQMNDIYSVIEKIAIRAEELRSDIVQLTQSQDELESQSRGVKEYFSQNTATAEKEDDIRAEMEAVQLQMEQALKDQRERHRREMENLQLAVQDRDQFIRKVYSDGCIR